MAQLKLNNPVKATILSPENLAAQADSYWQSLFYFSLYRLLVSSGFLSTAIIFGYELNLGAGNLPAFKLTAGLYVIAALGLAFSAGLIRKIFDFQLTAQVMIDVTFITLMMYYSGGQQSNIGVMLFIVLAGAGLVGQGRMTLLHASLATMAMLVEQAYRYMNLNEDLGSFFRVGLMCVGYFGTSITSHLLAYAVVANESLARRRGQELLNQQRINQRVIHDMEDGVLVVNSAHQVTQMNHQALVLLGSSNPTGELLSAFSSELATHFTEWLKHPIEQEIIINTANHRSLRVRILPPEEGEDTLIYLEDIGREQARLQQAKLAALGRLTANMAHEIRNPLSAISQAAELLNEEDTPTTRKKLTHIIGNNVQRLNRLVVEIMDVGRRDRAMPEKLNLLHQINEYIEEITVQDHELKQRLLVDCAPDIHILFDRIHWHRVLGNLVANAQRYASKNPAAINITARRTFGAGVVINIIDDGAGIPEELRQHIFEPFFTTDSSGTGLGLYIARELCEANHANLKLLDNAPGAHFCITCREANLV